MNPQNFNPGYFPQQPMYQMPYQNLPDDSGMFKKIIIIILVILILSGIGYVIYSSLEETTPATTPTAKPSAKPTATPATTPATTPAATPAATPDATPATTPAATPATTPATTPAAKPATTPTATPATTPAAKPATTPTATPAATPATTPAAKPMPTTSVIDGSTSIGPEVTLYNTQSIKSQNNQYSLNMQRDNNLVIYKGGEAIWVSGTADKGASGKGYFKFQQDGNLVLYDESNNSVLWSTNTEGKAAKSLRLQDNGNLVLFSEIGSVLWSSNFNLGTSEGNPMTIKIKRQYLDKGQFGNSNRGIYPYNGTDHQKFWLDGDGLFHSKQGQCLDVNGGRKWVWWNCDKNNSNQNGFKIITNDKGQKALKYKEGECLDVGNDNMHWHCDPSNENQSLTIS